MDLKEYLRSAADLIEATEAEAKTDTLKAVTDFSIYLVSVSLSMCEQAMEFAVADEASQTIEFLTRAIKANREMIAVIKRNFDQPCATHTPSKED